MYVIECRYEYWGPDGIKWTEWFPMYHKYNSLEDAKAILSTLSAQKPFNKLRHEYRLA